MILEIMGGGIFRRIQRQRLLGSRRIYSRWTRGRMGTEKTGAKMG
jgi:hypothetical protein